MLSHQLKGRLDQVRGIALELWGEVTGNEDLFSDGRLERYIGQVEAKYDLGRVEAEKKVEEVESRIYLNRQT